MRATSITAGLLVLIYLAMAMPVLAQGWGACETIPGNLVGALNCGFTDGVNHWTFSSAMGSWTAEPSTGYPTAPSGSAEATDPGSYAFTISSECIAVSAATEHTLGLYSRTPGGATISCAGRIAEYTTSDCTGSPSVSPDAAFSPALNLWTPWSVVWTTGAATQSAIGTIECTADASFTVLFDNGGLVEGSVLPVTLQRFTVD
jgi:hypothetical protein